MVIWVVFSLSAGIGLFFSSLERSGKKQADTGGRDRTEAEGGWQGVSESAVSAKPLFLYGLARNRRSPKRPPEPRPSGVHPEEGGVGESGLTPQVAEGSMENQRWNRRAEAHRRSRR